MVANRTNHYRAAWISDVHLGTRGSNAAALLDFLKENELDTLYVVGDLIDIWSLRRGIYWPQEHNDVIQKILRKARKGTRVRPADAGSDLMKKKPSGPASEETSPAKSLVIDLVNRRRAFAPDRLAYLRRLEGEIDEVLAWASEQAKEPDLPKSRIRDLGDMITLVRKLDAKPRKGRRRDLKKIDATVADLREMSAQKSDR